MRAPTDTPRTKAVERAPAAPSKRKRRRRCLYMGVGIDGSVCRGLHTRDELRPWKKSRLLPPPPPRLRRAMAVDHAVRAGGEAFG